MAVSGTTARRNSPPSSAAPLQRLFISVPNQHNTSTKEEPLPAKGDVTMVEINTKSGKGLGSCSAGKFVLYFVYLSILAACAAVALDALEYLSLGIVKDVLKMKVMSIEEFDKLTRLQGLLNGGCEDTKKKLEAVTKQKDIFESSMASFQTGYDHLKFEREKCNKAVGALSVERDSLKDTKKELEKKVATLEAELHNIKAAASSVPGPTDDDVGGRRLRRRRLTHIL